MLEGLMLTWDKGYKKVEVECDNLLLVELLQSGGGANTRIVEVCLIQQMLQRGWQVKVSYVSRVANVVAETMAKISTGNVFGLQFFQVSPAAVVQFL